MANWSADKSGRFPQRLFLQAAEIDRDCERLVAAFLREQNGDVLPDLLIDVTGSQLLRTALERGVPIVSTKEGAEWTAKAIAAAQGKELGVRSLQGWLRAEISESPK